ncbi:MAG TPA: phosphotransacetylase family protein [Candidatus Desulfofervidus auxilii]|uniref:Phosphotransacetylase family protein n=1 Tax=Desulfofervidus auxilii TaxID=1621989 RepID=A0A7C0Y5K1_DESA2|nr:phosphotransacetylase family protein [Candidatus Desulfofervidus auxilii]
MKIIYIGSTIPFSGKGLITLGVGKYFLEKGLKLGYFKPLGKVPLRVKNNIITDRVAYFIYQSLGLKDDLSYLCPVILDYELTVKVLRGEIEELMSKVKKAFETISTGKDIVIIGGAETVWLGSFLGISGLEVINTLNAKVILVNKYVGEPFLDGITEVKKALKDKLCGIILNWVKEEQKRDIEELIVPWLEQKGILVLGLIPYDNLLNAITVAELSERLGGQVLSGHEGLNKFIQNYLIGGMEVSRFVEYIRRSIDPAVIVGGDRADIQLVAIEEGAKCLVLTGNFIPNEIILSKADQKNVPIVLVRDDTYTVAKKVQDISARLSLEGKEKVERGLALVQKHLNFKQLEQILE